MALDDAELRRLEEIERHLTLDTPKLARALSREPRVERFTLPTVQVAGAALVLLAALGWMSVLTGSVVPVLLALPPVVAIASVLIWQHTNEPVPVKDADQEQASHPARNDGPPTWWFT